MHVTIHFDQETAPSVEEAAQATLRDLAKITVGGTLIMEVEDGDSTTVVEVSSTTFRQLTADVVPTETDLLYSARSWIEDTSVELVGALVDPETLTDQQVRASVEKHYPGGWAAFAAIGGQYG